MKNKQKIFQKLVLLVFLICFNFSGLKGFSQTPNDIILSWNVSVGCQVFNPPKENEIFSEDIGISTPCVKVCEGSYVTYTITGTLGTDPNVEWSAIGGATSAQVNTSTTSSILVHWGSPGDSSISYSMNSPNGGTITKTLCITVITKPQAAFSAYTIPGNDDGTRPRIAACVNQPITFHDLSTSNGGSNLQTAYWDFGDGQYLSTVSQNQYINHTYNHTDIYVVTLTVINQCGCSSTYKREVAIKDVGGFEISCPGVVCDGAIETYSLPSLEAGICEEYHYTAVGGDIVSNPNNGSVTVQWNHVDEFGFGQLIFQPTSCHLECLQPTTIQIPVIQTIGTIHGNTSMCLGSQETFTLPQWPTTDFQWHVLNNAMNSQALLINTDQRNEIVVQPTHAGTITLVCNYMNTFLHCGGSATLVIHVNSPQPITGPTSLCINTNGQYHTVSTQSVDWTLTQNNVVKATASGTTSFDYVFDHIGNYSLTVSGPDVCSGQTTSINVSPIPTTPALSNITLPTAPICPSAPYTYSVTVPNPAMDYNWTITGGTATGSSTDPDFTVNFNQTGPYSIQLTQHPKDQTTCNSQPLNITPVIFDILADISTSSTAVLFPITSCANLEVQYYAVNPTGGLYAQGETYTWSINPTYAGSITQGQGTNAVKVLWNNTVGPLAAHLVVQVAKCTRIVNIDKPITITPLPDLNYTRWM